MELLGPEKPGALLVKQEPYTQPNSKVQLLDISRSYHFNSNYFPLYNTSQEYDIVPGNHKLDKENYDFNNIDSFISPTKDELKSTEKFLECIQEKQENIPKNTQIKHEVLQNLSTAGDGTLSADHHTVQYLECIKYNHENIPGNIQIKHENDLNEENQSAVEVCTSPAVPHTVMKSCKTKKEAVSNNKADYEKKPVNKRRSTKADNVGIVEEVLDIPEFPGAKISYQCYITDTKTAKRKQIEMSKIKIKKKKTQKIKIQKIKIQKIKIQKFKIDKIKIKRKRKSKPKKERIKKGRKPPRFYKCMLCDFTCTMLQKMKEHINTHENDKSFACDQCQHVSEKLHIYMTHKLLHKDNYTFKCKHCQYEFKTHGELRDHIRESHAETKKYACDKCEYFTDLLKNYNRHVKIHAVVKPLTCEDCEYRCNTASLLRLHVTIHSNEKPFGCDECTYRSKRSTDVRKHKLTHLSVKALACDQCPYRTNARRDLLRHMSTHNKARPFKCKHCSYCGKDAGGLRKHAAVHTSEKPHKCAFCDFKCKKSENMRRHEALHK